MKTSRPRQGRTGDQQVDRAERAAARIATLESRIADDAMTRAALLGSIAAHGLVEPHRDHHAYALGADMADCELAIVDARPLRGLMSLGPIRVADLLDDAARDAPATHVTRLWTRLIDTGRASFDRRGIAVDAHRLEEGDPASDQRTVFASSLARTTAAHGHRDEVAFVHGADFFACGLFADDAIAMLGLMSIGPARLAAELRAVAGNKAVYVARLWPEILMRHREGYEARGSLVRWQRRWARYNVEFADWCARSGRGDEDWRAQAMTARQRHLVRDTAIIRGVAIPEEMDRGTAHDWLMVMGANALFRKDM